jgi:hypothetical protein
MNPFLKCWRGIEREREIAYSLADGGHTIALKDLDADSSGRSAEEGGAGHDGDGDERLHFE